MRLLPEKKRPSPWMSSSVMASRPSCRALRPVRSVMAGRFPWKSTWVGPVRSEAPMWSAINEINIDYFQFTPRVAQPRLLKEERVRTFAEVDLRISANLAMQEAGRCFNCGICNQCDNCRLFCPDLAVVRDQGPRGRSIDYDYCKGCGICVVECPRNAMSLEEEQGLGGDPA